MYIAYSYILALKISTISTSFVYYLSSKFNKKTVFFIILGLMYSLCSYVLCYYYCFMWLDSLYLLPLITLGIERLVDMQKSLLYFVSLLLAVIFNFYIGYMLCIYSLFYFVFYQICNYDKSKVKTNIKLFIIYSLLVGGASCIPIGLSVIGSYDITNKNISRYSIGIFDILKNLVYGTATTENSAIKTYNILIGTSIISLFLFMSFIFSKNVKKRTKIFMLGLILSFIFIACINPLDYFINGFHVCNGLPYRYSFIISFLILVCCSYVFEEKHNYLSFIIIIALLLNLYFIENSIIYIFEFFILLFYFLIVVFSKKYKDYLVLLLVTFEVLVVSCMCISNGANISYLNFKNIEEKINNIRSDKELYRTNFEGYNTNNEGAYFNIKSSSGFSSFNYKNSINYAINMGYNSNYLNLLNYQSNNIVGDMFDGIKYIFSYRNKNQTFYSRYDDNVFINNYYVGSIFGVRDEYLDYKITDSIINNSNNLIASTSGYNDVYEIIDIDKKIIEELDDYYVMSITVDSSNYEQLIVDFKNIIFIFDGEYFIKDYNYNNLENKYRYYAYSNTVDMNYDNIITLEGKNECFKIIYLVEKNDNYVLDVYGVNKELLDKSYEFYKNYQFNYSIFKDDYIEGDIELDTDMVVNTSISYDSGWSVYVDGKKVETLDVRSFITFKVGKGKHHVIMKYNIPFLKLFILITIISFIIVLLLSKKIFKKRLV